MPVLKRQRRLRAGGGASLERADFFWGWGEQAEAQAGRMKQVLRMWVLLPR